MEAQTKFAQFYQGNRFLVNAAISIGGLAILTYATMAIVKAVRKPSNQGGGTNGGGNAQEQATRVIRVVILEFLQQYLIQRLLLLLINLRTLWTIMVLMNKR